MDVKMFNLIENFRGVVMKREHPAFGPYNLLSKGKSKSKAPEGFSKAQEGPSKSKAPEGPGKSKATP